MERSDDVSAQLEALNEVEGVYTMVIELSSNLSCKVGRASRFSFSKGLYCYTGSALGRGSSSLKGRMMRHLGGRRKLFWHIDYLLSNSGVWIEALIYAEASVKKECDVNRAIVSQIGESRIVKGFGSSDCVMNCGGHLCHLDRLNLEEALGVVEAAFLTVGLKPSRAPIKLRSV